MEETSEDINKKVSARIREREKGKDYKDTDVVNYTRKYSAAYDIVTSQDLTKIETDNVTAYKLIEKSKIWPLYNTRELKESGNSSGAAYLKIKAREALSARPLDSKDARETYVKSIEKLRALLDPAKNVSEVTEVLKSFVNLDSFEFGVIPTTIRTSSWIQTSHTGNLKSYNSHDIEKYFDDIFGKRFYAFCKSSTEASKKVAVEARLYEGFTEEMESAAALQKKTTAQNYIDKHQKVIEAIKNLPDDKSTIMASVRELDKYANVPSYAKADVISYYNRQIDLWKKNVDNPKESLPKYFRAREDDWSWTGEKKKEAKAEVDELDKVAKSTQTIFQKYGMDDWKKSAVRTPLEYIKRTGGLTVEDIEVSKVTEDFGYRNVVFGNYVNNQERKENLRHFLGAMLDMHEIINVDVKEINKLGGLDINFGSTGCGSFSKAMACYFPALKAINLTKKKGDGSLAHEWSHYLDNILGEGPERKATSHQMATSYNTFFRSSEKIKTLFLEYKNWLMGGGEDRTVLVTYAAQRKYKFRLQGSTVEEAIKHVQERYPNYSKYENSESQDLLKYYGYIAYQLNDRKPLQVPLKTKSSYYYYISSCWGFDYYAAHDELFARAFSWFIEDALQQKGRVSNYLVDNVSGMGIMAMLVPRDQWPFPYKEEEKVFLRDWFDRLFSAIRTEYNIQPFHWNTQERGDEYSAYAPDKDAKVETGIIVDEDGNSTAEGEIETFANGYEFKRTVQDEKTVYQLIFGKEPKNVLISKLTKTGWNVYSKADDGAIIKFTEESFKTYKEAAEYLVEKEIHEEIIPTPSVKEELQNSMENSEKEEPEQWSLINIEQVLPGQYATLPDDKLGEAMGHVIHVKRVKTENDFVTLFGDGEVIKRKIGMEMAVKGQPSITTIYEEDWKPSVTIDGIKLKRTQIEKGKTNIRMEEDGFIFGIIYPSIIYPEPVSNYEAISIFKEKKSKENKKYFNIKECLLSDGDNENDYIVEGTKIHSLTGDKKVTYEVLEFEKEGIILKHIPDSVLDDTRTNKYVTYLELTELFERGKISIDKFQSVQSVIHCIKAIKTCFEKLDIIAYKSDVEKRLQQAEEEIIELKTPKVQKPSGTFYIWIKPLTAMDRAVYAKVIADEVGGFVAGYKLKGINVDLSGYVSAPEFMHLMETGEYKIVPELETKEIIIEPSTQDYKDALEGAETALEFTEDEKEKQDLQDYIDGLKIAIETME